jgi:hypothetical protein
MERLKKLGLSEIDHRLVKKLVVSGKIKVETFALFDDDEELCKILKDLIAEEPAGIHY